MKLLRKISLSNFGPTACQNCAHFKNDPATIEAAYPGLTTMSSGFASVRDRDGFCNCHELYLSAHDSCPDFAPNSPRDLSFSP